MTIARFIVSLFADGRIRVGSAIDQNGLLLNPSDEDMDKAFSTLTELESQYRLELPGIPPNISRDAALWGVLTIFRASSFLVYRDTNAEILRTAIETPCPVLPSPEACYSVDLTLRFLPDLIRLVKAASTNDPIVELLKSLARQWPLSSVGITGLGAVDARSFLDNECLKRIYVDRIIASGDRSRVDDPKVRDAVRAAIGMHRELAPQLVDSDKDDILESAAT